MTGKQLDARILGQLLLMQSVVINLPDKKSILSFVSKGLKDVPGVKNIYFIENITQSKKNDDCEEYFQIRLNDSYFGELKLELFDKTLYLPYREYVSNFIFMLGVIFEERNQRQINIEHQQLLETRIFERTQELVAEKENLIESQRRFDDLMTNINLLSVMLDAEGNIIFCNHFLLKITGYSLDEIIGKNWFVTFLPSNIRDQVKKIFNSIMEGGELTKYYENEILTKKGEALLISWNNTILRDKNKKIIGTASIGENITQRKLAEDALIKKNIEYQALNEEYISINEELYKSLEELKKTNINLEYAKAKAEESDRLKTAFLQNMSHEIRTPMNAIMGFSDLLLKNFDNKSKLEKFTTIISQRCNDLLDLMNDLLDIAKIESGQLPVKTEECDLIELFDDLTLFSLEFKSRNNLTNIQFKTHLINNAFNEKIITDQGKLKQILINLITNAFKYTDAGLVEMGVKLINNELEFYVSDTGMGIPEDKHQVIFERFVQLNNSDKKNMGGTGLGLPIVKGLVELQGGKVWVESSPGKGSVFYFSLPYIPNQNKAISQDSFNIKPLAHFDNKIALIVEDDIYNAEYLKEILMSIGFEVIITSFGKEAVKLTFEKKPDIILMDIRLPDIDGYEATRLIREKNTSITIIAQTAYASEDEKQKAIDWGCNEYISKPTKFNALIALISKYFQ